MLGAFKALSSPKKFFAGMWYSLMFVMSRFKLKGKARFVEGGTDFELWVEDQRPEEGDPTDELEASLKR